VDTSGIEPLAARGSLQARAAELTLAVLRRSDAALVMLDAKWGGVCLIDEVFLSFSEGFSWEGGGGLGMCGCLDEVLGCRVVVGV
jgi:hypothetical protein